MQLGSVLLLAGLILLPAYFILFYRTFKKNGVDAERYVEVFGKSKWRNLIAVLLVIAAFVVSTESLAIAFMGAALIWLTYETLRQNRRMKELDFGDGFRRQLARTSVLSPIALICLLGSKLWFQNLLN
jgi:flagellar biosynthesis component FlhA